MDRAASEEQLATEVSTLMRLMHPVKAAAARETGPGDGHDRSAMLLLFPLMSGPQRPGALAELSHADPSTISRQVSALVKAGLVERRADPGDGRASLLAATEAGVRVIETERRRRAQVIAAVLRGWSADDRTALTDLLHRFRDDYQSFEESS
jgi:DNA-binding MarR family transcriptional regulator